MANFESGVSRYITGTATVKVHFPVDLKGNEDISCYQCPFFKRSYSICGLNNEVCNYPSKYVGVNCPLEIMEVNDNASD